MSFFVSDAWAQAPGPAAPAGRVEPGDILVRMGGQAVPGFVTLEQILDEHVGETLVGYDEGTPVSL